MTTEQFDEEPDQHALTRPGSWPEYFGQEGLKRRLQIYIRAARETGRPLEHMLFVAPPGSGKTSLARLIAEELTDPYMELKMPMDPLNFIYRCRDFRGVMLLDEIHSAPKAFQEMLLPALEDGYLQTKDGRIIDVSKITFLGATTDPQLIRKPLWDRFKLKPKFDDYADEDMATIITAMASKLGFVIDDDVVADLSRAAGGTPRLASNLVLAARNLNDLGMDITTESVLDLAEVDCDGLTSRHLDYLRALFDLGGQSGLSNIQTMTQLPQTVVEDLERLLIRRKLIRLRPTGRELTDIAFKKLPDQQVYSGPGRRTQPTRRSA